tara:strand:+ start:27 stop:674 length:648 start_codon:yes stop_codon:yes gene_type:complete
MGQNTSHAVMSQRIEAHDSLDDFPTQPWATRAFVEHVLKAIGVDPQNLTAWEPACNRGFMARPLAEYFKHVHTSDIFDYGWQGQQRTCDFLWPDSEPSGPIDWVITNPPFRLAQQFIQRGLSVARDGMAVIVRSQFSEGINRYNEIYGPNPPNVEVHYAERVPMVKGRCDPKASTATAYSWFVWRKNAERLPSIWIPPCRKALERDGDYDDVGAA